jgi:tetratricopeptide (TPR) repeat protein
MPVGQGSARRRPEVQKQRPKEAIGYIFEGDAHASKKNWAEAAAPIVPVSRKLPAADLAVKLHAALLASGNTAEADKFAETWLKEHAKDAVSASIWPRVGDARKDYAGAARQYRILLEAQPENPPCSTTWPGLPDR